MTEQVASRSDDSTDNLSIATENAVTPLESFLPNPFDKTTSELGAVSSPNTYHSPEAESMYIIRSIKSHECLTLLKGEVVLAPSGSHGSQYWECIKLDGWLGFRNVASYGFLGRDGSWVLCCGALNQREWEKFHILSRGEGGFVMLMTHWGKLRPVDFREEQDGGKKLAMVEVESDNGILWEFLKI